jgi:hypothetical protein
MPPVPPVLDFQHFCLTIYHMDITFVMAYHMDLIGTDRSHAR